MQEGLSTRIDEINVAEIEAGLTKWRFAEMEVWLMKLLLLKWKLEWWKYVAEICCWNESGSYENNVFCNGSEIDLANVAEMEAGVMKKMFPEIQAGLMKLMLLK